MRGSLDFGGRADRLIGGQTALGVDQVGSKDRVDEGRFAQAGLTWSLVSAGHRARAGNIPTHMTLNWNPRFNSLRSIWEVMLSKPTWLWGKTEAGLAVAGPAVAIGGECGRNTGDRGQPGERVRVYSEI